MLFDRFEVEGLAHYSYAVGCPKAGAVAIVDPERNIDRYLEYAEQSGVRITHVLETHIHADFASGARALAEKTGARLLISAYDEGETFEASFPHEDLHDGDEIEIGPVRIVAVHTPGHTPEHMSYLVYDQLRSTDTPQLMLTGDFLFVGSLGRPDLLGEEQKRGLAKKLYQSVQNLAGLPDGLEIHPAHGAGSLCGAGLGGRPMTTLGFERIANPFLSGKLSEEQFVDLILGTVPEFPPYYVKMKKLNSVGAKHFEPAGAARAVTPAEFKALADGDHFVLDVRNRTEFSGAHVPGSLASDPGPSLVVWASWFAPYDKPILLVAHDRKEAMFAARVFARVGIDNTVGHLEGGINAWQEAGLPTAQTRWSSLSDLPGNTAVIDVRAKDEFEEGHVDGARHIFLGLLPESDLGAKDAPIALICKTGDRSTVGASVLEQHGFTNVYNISGGMLALEG
ncbi:MAG: MBL fold metallo-hydrolase [Planctomycetota bacterium]|jgi:hydroxyacylglutathione hydrolase